MVSFSKSCELTRLVATTNKRLQTWFSLWRGYVRASAPVIAVGTKQDLPPDQHKVHSGWSIHLVEPSHHSLRTQADTATILSWCTASGVLTRALFPRTTTESSLF